MWNIVIVVTVGEQLQPVQLLRFYVLGLTGSSDKQRRKIGNLDRKNSKLSELVNKVTDAAVLFRVGNIFFQTRKQRRS